MSGTVTETNRYTTTTLGDLPPGEPHHGRVRLPVRAELGIAAFGANAFRAVEDGGQVIGEHDEHGLGAARHEELYVVIHGHATFAVDGEEVDAPAGTLVAVQPGAKRGAVAREAGTTVLVVGAPRGKAFVISPGERIAAMWPHYEAGDYDAAIRILEDAAAERSHPLLSYNLACCENLRGRRKQALAHLEAALTGDSRLRENARGDSDFDSIREEPGFKALVEDAT